MSDYQFDDVAGIIGSFTDEHAQLREVIQISALKTSHERDILERLDGLLQTFQLSQSTWRVRFETLEQSHVELLQRHRELGAAAASTQERVRSLESDLAAVHATHEATLAELRAISGECDTRVAAVISSERQAANAWRESVAEEAQRLVEKALVAERERLKAAHVAGLDTVLSAAEKDRAAHVSASLQALQKADAAKCAALAAADAAAARCRKAEESARGAQAHAVTLQHQLAALREEYTVALSSAAEHRERCKQLQLMLDVTQQGQAELRRVVEARHAAELQAQQADAEASIAALKAALAAEARTMRERCEALVRQREERALEWRGRYFEVAARLEASEGAVASLSKDRERVVGGSVNTATGASADKPA